jgi:hypothetical protein
MHTRSEKRKTRTRQSKREEESARANESMENWAAEQNGSTYPQ